MLKWAIINNFEKTWELSMINIEVTKKVKIEKAMIKYIFLLSKRLETLWKIKKVKVQGEFKEIILRFNIILNVVLKKIDVN